MHGLVLVAVVGTDEGDNTFVDRAGDLARKRDLELALGSLDRNIGTTDGDVDAARHGDRSASNT